MSGAGVALKLLRAPRNSDVRTEFDRLQLGSKGEIGNRDSGWKSEEVFNAEEAADWPPMATS